MPVFQATEPMWRCTQCRDLRGWRQVEPAVGASTTVKPCRNCNAVLYAAWLEGKYRGGR